MRSIELAGYRTVVGVPSAVPAVTQVTRPCVLTSTSTVLAQRKTRMLVLQAPRDVGDGEMGGGGEPVAARPHHRVERDFMGGPMEHQEAADRRRKFAARAALAFGLLRGESDFRIALDFQDAALHFAVTHVAVAVAAGGGNHASARYRLVDQALLSDKQNDFFSTLARRVERVRRPHEVSASKKNISFLRFPVLNLA